MRDQASNGAFTETEFGDEPNILKEEIKEAIGILANRRAAGGDDIPIELLKAGGEETIGVMTALCNFIWKSKKWPKDWCKSIFVRIFKK